jgi:hypothetical protein
LRKFPILGPGVVLKAELLPPRHWWSFKNNSAAQPAFAFLAKANKWFSNSFTLEAAAVFRELLGINQVDLDWVA